MMKRTKYDLTHTLPIEFEFSAIRLLRNSTCHEFNYIFTDMHNLKKKKILYQQYLKSHKYFCRCKTVTPLRPPYNQNIIINNCQLITAIHSYEKNKIVQNKLQRYCRSVIFASIVFGVIS